MGGSIAKRQPTPAISARKLNSYLANKFHADNAAAQQLRRVRSLQHRPSVGARDPLLGVPSPSRRQRRRHCRYAHDEPIAWQHSPRRICLANTAESPDKLPGPRIPSRRRRVPHQSVPHQTNTRVALVGLCRRADIASPCAAHQNCAFAHDSPNCGMASDELRPIQPAAPRGLYNRDRPSQGGPITDTPRPGKSLQKRGPWDPADARPGRATSTSATLARVAGVIAVCKDMLLESRMVL
jgi:hypothetical protein